MTWLQRHWWWVLGVIILVGAGLRLWRIGAVPYGYTFDEAGIVYDAWSISLWHRDQFAHFMPLSFESFGDYKPPLLIYTLAVLYKFFGLHIIFIRLISAVAGIGSIGAIYGLSQELFRKHRQRQLIGILSALVVAFSPWSLHLSRLGFEQNLAFFLGLTGMWLLMVGLRKPAAWFGAVVCLAASMYTFHTAKIFVPLVLIFFGSLYRKQVSFKRLLFLTIGFLVLVSPLVYSSLFTFGGARAKTLIIYSENGSLTNLGMVLHRLGDNIRNYAAPAFWVGGWDGISLRHAVPGYGVLLWPMYLLFISLLVALIFSPRWRKIGLPLGLLTLFGLLPAIVSQQSPHVLRSQFTLIGVALFIAAGTVYFWQWLGNMPRIRIVGASILGLITLGCLGSYEHAYFGDYAIQSATAFQYGYQQVFQWLSRYPHEPVVISDTYQQPYVYALLYNRIAPQQFLWGGLNQYTFHHINWQTAQKNTIYVGSPEEIPINDPAVVTTVTVPQTNQVVWVIAKL